MSLPRPTVSSPDLLSLIRLAGIDGFTGALGALHLCPLCEGRPRDPRHAESGDVLLPESMRIHLSIREEVIAHCHACGFAGTAVDLFRLKSDLPWHGIEEKLKAARVHGDEAVIDEWIERSKNWESFLRLFEKGQEFFRRWSSIGKIEQLVFGEVGLCSAIQLERALPGVKLCSRWGHGNLFLVELRRTIHGLPADILIRHRKKGHTVGYYTFRPNEPLKLMVPAWVAFQDWGSEMIVFTDLTMAGHLHGLVWKSPSGDPTPLAWVADCTGPLIDEIPFRTVRFIPGPDESPAFALAFAQPGVEVLVKSEDAVKQVADRIVQRPHGSPDALAYLQTILQKPWISNTIGRRLTETVAAKLGRSAADLIAGSGATDRILPCRIQGTTYLFRNGVYAKKRGKQDWEPCTNYSLRIEESLLDNDRQIAHHLLLLLDGKTANFTVSHRELIDGRLLHEKTTAAAIEHGLPDLPRILEPGDLKRLPQIVQATQLKPALRTESPSILGFDRGRFHGPNFTATSRGVQFRAFHAAADARWIHPENPWEPHDDHLKCRANELAAWLTSLEPAERQMASVIIYAALACLQRGSRGLPSFILLPSDAHLELLGELTGLLSIEVGRGPKVQLGVPRLMRSVYNRTEQFEKQGRIVAALEDRHRKTDPRIPIVLHKWTGTTVPSPPAGILALLTHCVLGTSEALPPVIRLLSLVECPELRRNLQPELQNAADYLADTGSYLDSFLSAASKLPDLEKHVFRRSEKTYLSRETVTRLNEDFHFDFKETRLIDELRERYLLPQPARYGREQVPAFRLPPEAIARI
jgi:hypothetical protein